MTSKELFLQTMRCKADTPVPVTAHWWGAYKFAYAGLIKNYSDSENGWKLNGEALADVDSRFYDDFHPDTFHLSAGGRKRSAAWFENKASGEGLRLFQAVRSLESRQAIDDYIGAIGEPCESVLAGEEFEHIRFLKARYGDAAPILMNEGNPICNILDPHGCVGFEEGLVALLEKPEMMEYLIWRSYEAIIPRMEALKECGADGYIGSETYCGSELISPKLWRSLIYPAQKWFYGKLREMGMCSITYFLGDVNPILEDIKQMNVDALMVEESKKSFTLDIGEIYDRLERQVCLFGNLDSVYVLQMGTADDVVRETERQIKRCSKGGFIMSNGCPISFGTKPENIHAMIDTVKNAFPV